MNEPLDDLYLRWLYSLVANPRSRNVTWWNLLRRMYCKEFIWFVPNDDNRAQDGQSLRYEFIEEQGLADVDPDWMDLGCSMLELLITLSRELSFLAEGEPRDWFFDMLNNLDLRCDDKHYPGNDYVEGVLDNVIWRTYKPNGKGGLFPLRRPDQDQRDVELWYQLNRYVRECA